MRKSIVFLYLYFTVHIFPIRNPNFFLQNNINNYNIYISKVSSYNNSIQNYDYKGGFFMLHMDDKRMQDLLKKYKLVPQNVANEAQVRKNVSNNLKYFMFKYRAENQVGMPQNNMAELLGITPPQLTKILKGSQTPTIFPCLESIKRIFGYSIDEFLYTDIRKTEKLMYGVGENLPVASYMKFLGLYQLYYFDTSSFKGRERKTNREAIKSGIMYVEKNAKTDKYEVLAIFNMNKERADEFYRNTLKEGRENWDACRESIMSVSDLQHVYYGELELSERHIYVNLRFENTRDRVQMIFHRPESSSEQYIGGLGAMVSVSKGRNASPCVGYIAIANGSPNVSAEEMAAHLLMHYPNIKAHGELNNIIDFMIEFYTSDYSRLSDRHKKEIVEKEVDRVINETIERNLFRKVVVSPVDDDEFYHYLKRVLGKN